MFRRPSTNVQPLHGGRQWLYYFANGYGASVVQHQRSYSGPRTFEVAVLHGEDLCYRSGLARDVRCDQTHAEIADFLDAIEALPNRDRCTHDIMMEV